MNILSISGHQPINLVTSNLNSYENLSLSLKRPHSWGWATWKNRWIGVDWSSEFLVQAAFSKDIRRNLSSMGLDTVPMLRSQIQGHINSWAISFCVHASVTEQKTIYPITTLTINTGHGDESTHTGSFIRKQPKLLIYCFRIFRRFSNQSFLSMLVDTAMFRYFSFTPAKAEENA